MHPISRRGHSSSVLAFEHLSSTVLDEIGFKFIGFKFNFMNFIDELFMPKKRN